MAGMALSSSTVGRCILEINGTLPGVLILIICQCTIGVVLIFRFAIGLRDTMMPGASVMRWMVMMGESLITFCCSALTLCSTLCSIAGAGRGGGGVKILLMCDCKILSKQCHLVVVPAIVPSAANSSVSS
jgi:hypothetical protein